MDNVFISGEPVTSGGRGQDEWQDKIRRSVRAAVRVPSLTFVVSSLRRRGHPFDLDNLIHPVLMVFDEPIDCVSARMYLGERPGLVVEERAPDRPPSIVLRSLYVASHSAKNEGGRTGLSEIAQDAVFDDHEGIGLMLEFDSSDIPIRKGWFGPTEAVVDDLGPWLGYYTSRNLVADHRIRDIRFVRGCNPTTNGVRVSIWYVPDQELVVPEKVLSLN